MLSLSLADDLGDLASPGDTPDQTTRPRASHPSGWEPGVTWDGTAGTLTTPPLTEQPKSWDDIIRVWGMNPDEVEIVEPVQFRAWDAQTPEGLKRMFYYRAAMRRRREGVNVDELVDIVSKWKPRKKADELDGDGLAFVVAYADMQFGKPDGDGSEGTIRRVLEKTEAAMWRLKELRRAGRKIDTIYLPFLGDCIEGTQSQGGRLIARLDLTLTEQVRVYRRVMLKVVQEFAPLADRVILPIIPGNHDEATRTGDQMSTRYDDSWAIEGASAVADSLALAPDGYGHVSFVFPKKDELTLTLDMAGTVVGLAHGHQTKGKTHTWWANQAHGMQPIGDATLLLTGHYHHLKVDRSGVKTWIQTPALDGGSTWWKHRQGQDAAAGLVTLAVGNGTWGDLAVL